MCSAFAYEYDAVFFNTHKIFCAPFEYKNISHDIDMYLGGEKLGWADLIRHLQDDVIKWKHFPRYWPFARGIHWFLPGNSPHKGQ